MLELDTAGGSAGTAHVSAEAAFDNVAAPERDRRQSRRMPYACTAIVAAYLPPDIPPRESFWTVRCRDLSRGGVSFYSPIKPSASSLVISLSSMRSLNLLLACRVVYCAYVGDQGQPQYLVGCEFVERLNEVG